MVRPSPQTERLVEIIEMLAEARDTGRSLAEITAHLALSKATIHPMLAELVNVGWLIRDPRTKRFRLGPRLVAVGEAAEESSDIIDIARAHSLSLAQRIDATCMLVTPGPQGAVVVDIATGSAKARARSANGSAIGLKLGDTINSFPPLASVIPAWGGEGDRAEWLSHAAPTDRPYLEECLALERERGFAVEEYRPAPDPLGELVHATIGDARGSHRARLLQQGISSAGELRLVGEIEVDEEYHPISINAPIVDSEGRVAHILLVTDVELPMSGRTVESIGEALVATTRLIMRDSGRRRVD